MPAYYIYFCRSCGHQERRYRNVKKCRKCGAAAVVRLNEQKNLDANGRNNGKGTMTWTI